MKAKKIAILGIGNTLLKDEGIGIHVIEKMQSLNLPNNVELIDGGTLGPDLIDFIENKDKVIIIDAVEFNQKPGTILKFSPEDFKAGQVKELSLHEVGLTEALDLVKKFNKTKFPKEILIIGIQPKKIDWGMKPTDLLKNKVPEIIEIILKELKGPE